MGIGLPNGGNSASATPPAGDQANCVIASGINGVLPFTGAGQVSPAFCIWGAFNVILYPTATYNLTTLNASAAALLSSTIGVSPGNTLVATNIPGGSGTIQTATTTGVGTTTSVQIGGLTTAQIATITGATVPATIIGSLEGAAGTIQLERSFDGGLTWVVCGIGGAGAPASYQFGGSGGLTSPVSFVVAEPEKGVAYRLNCTLFTSGTIAFRISTTGMAALPWGIQVG